MDASMELWNMFSTDLVEGSDDYMADSSNTNDFTLPNVNSVKDEPQEISESENDDTNAECFNTEFDPGSLLEQNCDEKVDEKVNEKDDLNDDNAIFNFELTPKLKNVSNNKKNNSVTPQQPARLVYVDRAADGTAVNYDTAVIYICPACGAEFSAQDQWKRHMNSLHQYNTRHGLNFVQIDKLYHKCLQCHKNIAMHSMENLLKHKFTHLPYRCTKCRICLRQYKYRQDLMVHLRMAHREDVMQLTQDYNRSENNVRNSNTATNTSNSRQLQNVTPKFLEIMDIKESAHDIFENTNDSITVRNELIEPDDDVEFIDQPKKKSENILPTFAEDSISSQSDSRPGVDSDDTLEAYIQYNCPQCGTEFENFGQWRQHIDAVHDFGKRKGLNFQEINMGRQIQCLECNEVIYENTLQNMQFHKFNHLPHKWIHCKLCYCNFMETKTVVEHLRKQHRLEGNMPDYDNEESQGNSTKQQGGTVVEPEGDDDEEESDNTLLSEQSISRDVFEAHIDYICPQCGVAFFERKQWRKHIVVFHQLADIKVLNFRQINDRQLMCNECKKVITNAYGIQNAQQHKITHMPFKAFARCRKCSKSYTDRKGLVKHLKTRHFIGREDLNTWRDAPNTSTSGGRNNALFKPTVQQRQQQYQPAAAQPKKPLHKQIVRHGDVCYEIVYLDDYDDGLLGDNDELTGSTVNDAGGSGDSFNKFKCSDCASIFSTQNALQQHIKQEHDFLDYHNLQPVKKSNGSHVKENKLKMGDQSTQSILPNGSVDDEVSRTSSSGIGFVNDESSLEQHFSYLCPACGHEYKSQNEWRRHINETHNYDKRHYLNFRQVDKKRHQCRTCNDIVSNSKLKALQDHHFRHLPYRLFIKCHHCSTRYNHKPNMISHLRVRHNIVDPNASTTNEDTNRAQKSTTALQRSAPSSSFVAAKSARPVGLNTVEDTISFHNAVDLDFITYFCPQCNENFDSHVFWRKHIVDAHNLASREGLNFRQLDNHHYLCLECYKRVTVTHTKGAIGQLQSHKFRHLPYRSFKCLTCSGEFVRKQMFFKHLNRATNQCDSLEASITTVTNDTTLSEALQQATFVLVCPACGERFDTQRPWREHINIEHGLNKRDCLNISKVAANLHQCVECGEHINGNKLRDLQIHKFKHLPHGPYLQCKFCPQAYNHIRNMQDHLQLKHPEVLQKNEDYNRLDQHDEICLLDDSDNEDNGNIMTNDECNDNVPENDNIDDNDNDNGLVNDDEPMFNWKPELEEDDDDDKVNDDEQYLLG